MNKKLVSFETYMRRFEEKFGAKIVDYEKAVGIYAEKTKKLIDDEKKYEDFMKQTCKIDDDTIIEINIKAGRASAKKYLAEKEADEKNDYESYEIDYETESEEEFKDCKNVVDKENGSKDKLEELKDPKDPDADSKKKKGDYMCPTCGYDNVKAEDPKCSGCGQRFNGEYLYL